MTNDSLVPPEQTWDVEDVLVVLRRMQVLAEFTPDQLRWVAEHGIVTEAAAGDTVIHIGDAHAGFWLLMGGTISILRDDEDGSLFQAETTDHLGSWAGRIPLTGEPSPITVHAETAARFLRLSDDDADAMLASGMPLGKHLIAGIQMGSRRFEARLRERERLASLGRLSAGLSHELNNPAAAIARAAAQLRTALLEQQRLSVCLRAAPDVADAVASATADLSDRAGRTAALSGLARADAEQAVAEWLEARDVDEAWQVASGLSEAGADPAWLGERLGAISPQDLPAVVSVIAASATGQSLTQEIEQASARISALVSAVKSYTNMDGAGLQDVDVRAGITSTLTMLAHKLRPYTVTTDWPADLPAVPGNPGELNQVWTNLLDNAADALSDTANGVIAVTAEKVDDAVVVRVRDNGPGMAPDVAETVFDPFFTTKAVGSGTGMGLDFVWRIVAEAHHGRVSVESAPGHETVFTVRLPLLKAPQDADKQLR